MTISRVRPRLRRKRIGARGNRKTPAIRGRWGNGGNSLHGAEFDSILFRDCSVFRGPTFFVSFASFVVPFFRQSRLNGQDLRIRQMPRRRADTGTDEDVVRTPSVTLFFLSGFAFPSSFIFRISDASGLDLGIMEQCISNVPFYSFPCWGAR